MKYFRLVLSLIFVFAASTYASVTVTSPSPGSTVTSPVSYLATATAPACAKGVASMGIYVNNKLTYTVKGSQLNTTLTLAAGAEHTVVEEWDKCGKASYTTVNLTVASGTQTTVTLTANPSTIASGGSSTLTAKAANATQIVITGSDNSSYRLPGTGGTVSVTPAATTTYGATATGTSNSASASAVVTVKASPAATVTINANPTAIAAGNSATLTVTATNASTLVITGTDNSSYSLPDAGGTQIVTPATTTTYSVVATSSGGNATASAIVMVDSAAQLNSIDHVIFLQQENHTFDNYFGMLNPYRVSQGWNVGDDGVTYTVDGIDDKLKTLSNKDDAGTVYSPFKFVSTCIDDNSSDWLASFGDVSPYNHLPSRPISMSGFVHNAAGYANSCIASGTCSGKFTDTTGLSAMGYYDQGYLNYYYWLASEFAVSDRWFSPIASKSVDNRIATFSGGTTQGLVKDPGGDDHLPQLSMETIFQELDAAKVSWKIYFTVSEGFCLQEDECTDHNNAAYPATYFSNFSYSYKYLHGDPTGTCTAPLQPSSVVGDAGNSFCIDPTHIAPLSTYYSDLVDGTLPSFVFIEAGYGNNDEHPGSGQSVLYGQAQVAKVVNALMSSSSWSDSVFFFAYDEGGGPYDHVPPVPGHSNDFTDKSLGPIPDISTISVQPDSYYPCVAPNGVATTHCDLSSTEEGSNPADAAAISGFGAQLGFRVPNAIVSPFVRRHYVSHTPIDHTAVIKFVENRFIGPNAHLTQRDAVQPNLLEFFDFTNVPWQAPPTPPAPVTATELGFNPCTPAKM
jgi:phospholipase C